MRFYTMPAGKYLVGDPCYFFSDKDHEEWIQFLRTNQYIGDEDDGEGEGYLVGTDKKVCIFSTKYGDGSYSDEFGNLYDVDAGMIGVIPLVEGGDVPHGMTVIEFDKDFECYNNDGILYFGDIVIDTAGTTKDEIEEDEDYNNYDEGTLYDEL